MSSSVVDVSEDDNVVKDKFAEIYVMLRDHGDENGVPVFSQKVE